MQEFPGHGKARPLALRSGGWLRVVRRLAAGRLAGLRRRSGARRGYRQLLGQDDFDRVGIRLAGRAYPLARSGSHVARQHLHGDAMSSKPLAHAGNAPSLKRQVAPGPALGESRKAHLAHAPTLQSPGAQRELFLRSRIESIVAGGEVEREKSRRRRHQKDFPVGLTARQDGLDVAPSREADIAARPPRVSRAPSTGRDSPRRCSSAKRTEVRPAVPASPGKSAPAGLTSLETIQQRRGPVWHPAAAAAPSCS